MTKPPPPLAERKQPGLSATLPYPRSLDTCQSCGLIADPSDAVALKKWIEHDPWDRPTTTLVILCGPCSRGLVDPHPRLYKEMHWWHPHPGAMELCHGCAFQKQLACTHRDLKANGGPGLHVKFPRPDSAHLNYGGGRGEFIHLFKGPPTSCAGRTVADE